MSKKLDEELADAIMAKGADEAAGHDGGVVKAVRAAPRTEAPKKKDADKPNQETPEPAR